MTVTKGAGSAVNAAWTACGARATWCTAARDRSPALSWTASHCGLGNSGSASFDPGTPAANGWFYFVIVGQTATQEGSYGTGILGTP